MELPPDAEALASNATYPNQAFRVGDAAWGLQFHIETTAEMVLTWALDDGLDPVPIIEPIRFATDRLEAAGRDLAHRFGEAITG
jgi:GMP synthase-like glutamine amidotransferase